MAINARLAVPVLLGLICLVGALPNVQDETENYRRLEAMPLERRQALSENLERFDKLDPKAQAAIRRFDDELAREHPDNQARYRATLRRYHLWVNGLSDEQKKILEAAESIEARLALAKKFRDAEREKKLSLGPRVAGIRTGDIGMMGPFEAAHLLKIWQKLPPDTRVNLEKRSGDRLYNDLRAHGKTMKVGFEPFPGQEELQYEALLDKDADFNALFNPQAKRGAALKAGDKAAEKAAAKAEVAQRKFQHPFAEFLYFEAHPPKAVTPANLSRFAASCPSWLLIAVDPLSPDDARNYLTILYRRLYPSPGEFEAAGDPKSKPKPGTGASDPGPTKK